MLQLTSPRHLSAQTVVPNAAEQIAGAVAPVPEAMREGATVLGYDANNELTTLREGSNELICIADTPGDDRFQAVCYHRSLEPFMARGRELRAEGLSAEENLRIRHEEADAGKLEMPAMPALFYNMAGPIEGFDSATAPISLFAIYTPYATAESTGMPARPARPGGPWIMRPGTASAHIMIIPPGADH
jgi:hypothetical protein